ncbi:carboxymuconolactone decarboxylase family protein [Janibacter terrae]|uniref:Carboxymuconolactone decarboxylase family protein n=1 Tax=Janibacter terrae TaxID=103817 RepID=A0ABZ2FG51_9MICO
MSRSVPPTDLTAPASRVPLRADADGDALLRSIYDKVTATTGRVPTLYQALGNAPAQLQGWIDAAWALRAQAHSDRALRELAILRCAYLAQSEYVWCSHVRLAAVEGASEQQVAHITQWSAHRADYPPAMQAVLALTDDLAGQGKVAEATWKAAAEHLDPEALVEVVLTLSWYLHVARVVDTLHIPPEGYHARVAPLPPRPGTGAPDQEK